MITVKLTPQQVLVFRELLMAQQAANRDIAVATGVIAPATVTKDMNASINLDEELITFTPEPPPNPGPTTDLQTEGSEV